jgi:hypothetical protein
MCEDPKPCEGQRPSIQALQTDIGFGNQFRLELIKTTMALATGLLAFTVAFRPTLVQPVNTQLMWVGWLGLGLSAIGAMINMYGWERFYISYRDHKDDQAKGAAARKVITAWRRFGASLQFAGFAAGVLSIAVFAAQNLDRVRVDGG